MFAIIVSVICLMYVPSGVQLSFVISVFANLFTNSIKKKGNFTMKIGSKLMSCGGKMRKEHDRVFEMIQYKQSIYKHPPRTNSERSILLMVSSRIL